ncbi:MAG: FAD-dependent oxidoreductase [Lentisphaerae bacterium]|nr:FAD-dependent oxidoreductase [Lentisphaerota bacterium]
MSAEMIYSKAVPVRHQVDVMVAGGGPAGVAAALTAARQGHSVFLAESQSCFGGMGTAGMVPAFSTFSDGINVLADGIGREILEALGVEKGSGSPLATYAIPAEPLKRVYDRLMTAAGVAFAFQTTVLDVVARDGHVEQALCWGKSGLFAVQARLYIDGTGDGDLAAWAGAPFDKGDGEGAMMPGTLCSLWADVDWEAYRASGINPRTLLPQAFADGIFTVHDPHHPGMWRVGRHLVGGNIGHAFGVDATDERSVTAHLVEARARLPEFERFYRERVPGFQNLELAGSGAVLGIRESRRILGDYVLNIDDFKARAVFPDEIGRYCYPVDIHPSKPDPVRYASFEKEFFETLRYKKGESYGIPYRILTPRKLDNLLVAGRCVSSDRGIQGSIRVMPGCYITGQAAGMAAALAIEHHTDTRGIPVGELQRRLRAMGAYLPNLE